MLIPVFDKEFLAALNLRAVRQKSTNPPAEIFVLCGEYKLLPPRKCPRRQ